MTDPVCIDGSYGEGGGQILRTALSLAVVTGRTVEIHNIRAKRPKPGLQPQHLAAVRAAAALCDAALQGAGPGSLWLRFAPGRPARPGAWRFDIGTAGATTLVAQTVLLPLALAVGPSRVTVTGGTHVPHAPPAEYLEAVYLPTLRAAGLIAACRYDVAGFFPRGGGELQLEIPGGDRLRPIDAAERGPLRELRAFVVSSNLPEHVARRAAATLEKLLAGRGVEVTIEVREKPSLGTGAAVVLVTRTAGGRAGFTALGARGKPVERVVEEAVRAFRAWWSSGAACDEHLGDQLVLPAALAAGESRWTVPVVTEHLRTALWVAERFLPLGIRLEPVDGGPTEVRLESEGVPPAP